MQKKVDIAQLFLRIVLGLGFLFPVMDRVGWLGEAGVNGNAWGNWTNFIAYTQTLIPYISGSLTNIFAVLATMAEVLFGITLIIGYKTRFVAIGSFLLTLSFALSMFFFVDFRAPFSYSVFADSAASLLLATLLRYRWSIDDSISK